MKTNVDTRKMYHVEGTDKILRHLDDKSHSITEYIREHETSKFELFYKYIKHADVSGRGKARKGDDIEKNILNYMTVSDMHRKRKAGTMQVAAQTNINLSRECLDVLGIKEDYKGALDTINWYIVNDSIKNFNYEKTKEVCDKLHKNCQKFKDVKFTISDGPFTPVKVSKAAHGIGGKNDKEFNNLRCTIFNNDKLYLLIEHTAPKNVFILLEKSPIYHYLIGEWSESWKNYQELVNLKRDSNAQDIIGETKTRSLQREWKRMLADEMHNYTQNTDDVVCPFTWKQANFESVPMLFIASHIVPFKDCKIEEAYDRDNGLLLSANADALFDKHLISVDEEGHLVFSKKINNPVFIHEFNLDNKIMADVLTEKRKNYLARHYEEFRRLENNMLDAEEYILNKAEF